MNLKKYTIAIEHHDVEHDDAYDFIYRKSYNYIAFSSYSWLEGILSVYHDSVYDQDLENIVADHINSINNLSFFPLPHNSLVEIQFEILNSLLAADNTSTFKH